MEIITIIPEKKRKVSLRSDIYKEIQIGVVNDYYNTNLSIKEIITKYGISKSSCYKYIRQHGIVKNN